MMVVPLGNNVLMPFEQVFNGLRGIKGASLDLRRNKDALSESLDKIWELTCAPTIQTASSGEKPAGYISDFAISLLGHTVCNPKQFGDIYWRYISRIVDIAVESGKTICVYAEGDVTPFAEYFQDVPKGTMMIQAEQGDLREIRKKLPNIALIGGQDTTLLGHGTAQACIDQAKSIIQDMGEGFALCTDKMLSYPNDAIRENIIAVNEFVHAGNY